MLFYFIITISGLLLLGCYDPSPAERAETHPLDGQILYTVDGEAYGLFMSGISIERYAVCRIEEADVNPIKEIQNEE
jgi:hypothetical protein